jgi:hypothetical protein
LTLLPIWKHGCRTTKNREWKACYAEKLRRLRFDPEQSIELLRKGANQLEIDLHRARMELPQDPGVEVCDGVLQEIHHLLQPPTPLAPSRHLRK